MITFVAAMDRNRAIGKEGEIPWDIPEDVELFKDVTRGGAVIMGRGTWDSLPQKPLPDRENIVVDVGSEREENGAVFTGLEAAMDRATASGKEILVIGGEQIFRQLLPRADCLLLTYVDLSIEKPDTFFPEFDMADWKVARRETLRADDPNCELVEYIRQDFGCARQSRVRESQPKRRSTRPAKREIPAIPRSDQLEFRVTKSMVSFLTRHAWEYRRQLCGPCIIGTSGEREGHSRTVAVNRQSTYRTEILAWRKTRNLMSDASFLPPPTLK